MNPWEKFRISRRALLASPFALAAGKNNLQEISGNKTIYDVNALLNIIPTSEIDDQIKEFISPSKRPEDLALEAAKNADLRRAAAYLKISDIPLSRKATILWTSAHETSKKYYAEAHKTSDNLRKRTLARAADSALNLMTILSTLEKVHLDSEKMWKENHETISFQLIDHIKMKPEEFANFRKSP